MLAWCYLVPQRATSSQRERYCWRPRHWDPASWPGRTRQSLVLSLTPMLCFTQADWQCPGLQPPHLAPWTGTHCPARHQWVPSPPQLVPSRGGPVSTTSLPSLHWRDWQMEVSCSAAPEPSKPLKKKRVVPQ